jgi:hypothetical protein
MDKLCPYPRIASSKSWANTGVCSFIKCSEVENRTCHHTTKILKCRIRKKKKEVQEYDGEPSSCVWEGVEKNRNSTADKTPNEV